MTTYEAIAADVKSLESDLQEKRFANLDSGLADVSDASHTGHVVSDLNEPGVK